MAITLNYYFDTLFNQIILRILRIFLVYKNIKIGQSAKYEVHKNIFDDVFNLYPVV